jgi:F420-0:gamma-glutamyl ligase
VGTVVRGIRTPIIKKGDNLVEIAAQSILTSAKSEGFSLNDKDVVGVTEAVVAKAEGNYATLAQIAADVSAKFPGGEIGLVLPILSRNRFSLILKGIAKGVSKITIQLSYPSDEVGNPLISLDKLDQTGINPYQDVLSEAEFRKHFGKVVHPFTGVDYIEYYREICDGKAEIILANDPRAILDYKDHIINADIHTRRRTKNILLSAGAKTVVSLDEILSKSVNGSGYHPDFGLLGSNMATDNSVKLFPKSGRDFVDALAKRLKELTGKNIEIMVYGDGAFKDPAGGIWELADPIVSPAYTKGLEGLPNEVKLKYLADNVFGDLDGEAATEAVKNAIKEKEKNLVNNMASEGTTPRRLTDLLGSLCDLTSGSGDKGTPVVLIQGYFDNYAS